MKFVSATFPATFAKTSLVATTFVLAMASPAGAISTSLSASSLLDQFKTTVTSAIDSSITKLQDSSNSLNFSISATADKSGLNVSGTGPAGTVSGSAGSSGVSGSASGTNGSSASGSVSSSGASGSVSSSAGSASSSTSPSSGNSAISFDPTSLLQGILSIPKELKQKLQDANKKAIDQLTILKTEVLATANIQDVQAKAKQFDQEFKQIATANVQASVTKSMDSQTQVLDRLQVAANNIQTQVNKLKDCIQSGSASATGTIGSGTANGSVNASAPGCTDLNVDANSGDNGQSLQDQIDEIKSSLQTVRSFLSSSISLIGQLKEGNYSGTIKSFNGIDSQIDITANLSSDIQNELVNLSAAVNK
ncbi:MAG: hypothetical protein JWO07_712 [Candidatus Saccharibacteria bacterium]|nr:hypothetical protein [Candidatus Saccharibacteria bacterium]